MPLVVLDQRPNMPFTYQIDPGEQLTTIRLSGTVTGKEMLTAHRTIVADPAWQPGFCRLWDYRRVQLLDVLPDDVWAIRDEMCLPEYRSGAAASIVKRELEFGLVELFRLTNPQWKLCAFKDEESARAWLSEQRATVGPDGEH